MKLSMSQMIAIVCILSVGFMTAAPFVQTAEAGVTKITITSYSYQCVKDGGHCVSPSNWTETSSEESWWHRNFGSHPHGYTIEEVSRYVTQVVTDCDDCSF